VEYFFHPLTATVRQRVSLSNPSNSAISTTVSSQTNVGSDHYTQIISSSSGDRLFTTDDRWVITDDLSTNGDDPTITHVLFGPGSPEVTPSLVDTSVDINSGGLEGIRADYGITVDPGDELFLMFFSQLSPSEAAAISTASMFDSDFNMLSAGLLAGLTEDQLERTLNLNWDEGISVPEPPMSLLIGSTLLLIGGAGFTRRCRD
jgi:hypothetical protein